MADEAVYSVVPTPLALEKMRTWGRTAVSKGLGDWFIHALQHIDRRLQTDPVTWGDPSYNYRQARLRVYRANHENFIVYYAIHFDRPIVFLRNLELFAGSPLFGE